MEAAGVPDRVGMFGGLRMKVAQMLVDACRRVGEQAFRRAAQDVVEAVCDYARDSAEGT